MRVAAFWDSSALVPLCVRQRITASVTRLYNAYDVVVWWGTPVEIASALSRLAHMKHVAASDYGKARKLAQSLSDSWLVVQPSNNLNATAIRLVERYELRAADALQLSAALEWCEAEPTEAEFLTADVRLRQAAEAAGFDCPAL